MRNRRASEHGRPYFVERFSLAELTAAGLPVLLLFKNWYLFNTRLRVGYVLPIFVVLYAALLVYQSALLNRFPAMK